MPAATNRAEEQLRVFVAELERPVNPDTGSPDKSEARRRQPRTGHRRRVVGASKDAHQDGSPADESQ